MSDGNDLSGQAAPTKWNPSITFFRSGQVDLGDYGRVAWTFDAVRGRLPFNFVRCKLTTFGRDAWGYGYAFRLHDAMCRAMGEAWERAWLLKITNDGIPEGLQILSSNGFAAGPSDVEAASASRAELIERAVFLRAWATMKGWSPYAFQNLPARLMAQVLRAGGWRLDCFVLSTASIGSVLAGLIQHPTFGAVFDTAHTETDLLLPAIEGKLLRSLMRSAEIAGTRADRGLDVLPEVGGPDDHGRYYLDPRRAEAFSFLSRPDVHEGLINLPDADGIRTKMLYSAAQLPAVAVSYHPGWLPLTWGQSSIAGENPWPHPLA